MKPIAILVLLSASSLFGQESPRVPLPAPGEKSVTKVFTLKYSIRIGNSDISLLDGIGLNIKRSGDIVVITGPQDRVDTAEAILKQLDVPAPPPPPVAPKKNIQLTAYLIIASPSGTQGTPLPKDLESAVTQVASVFPYKAFNLFDAIVMRMTDGSGGSMQGILPRAAFPSGGTYSLNLNQIMLSQPLGGMHLNSFDLSVLVSNGMDKEGKDKFQTVKLSTRFMEIEEGQKVVVGKANIDGSSNALIVILTAKVVD